MKPDARLSDPSYLARFNGDYELAGQTATFSLTGNIITITLPCEPQSHLVPGLGNEFVLKEQSAISVNFVEDARETSPARASASWEPCI